MSEYITVEGFPIIVGECYELRNRLKLFVSILDKHYEKWKCIRGNILGYDSLFNWYPSGKFNDQSPSDKDIMRPWKDKQTKLEVTDEMVKSAYSTYCATTVYHEDKQIAMKAALQAVFDHIGAGDKMVEEQSGPNIIWTRVGKYWLQCGEDGCKTRVAPPASYCSHHSKEKQSESVGKADEVEKVSNSTPLEKHFSDATKKVVKDFVEMIQISTIPITADLYHAYLMASPEYQALKALVDNNSSEKPNSSKDHIPEGTKKVKPVRKNKLSIIFILKRYKFSISFSYPRYKLEKTPSFRMD